MACEVANSPFSEHAFESVERSALDRDEEFDKIVNGSNDDEPYFAFEKPETPPSAYNTAAFNANGLELTSEHGPGMYPYFTNEAQPSPYLDPFRSPAPHLSPLRHSFRRSVSEPPDGLQHHLAKPGPRPLTTFHRDGHYLGDQVKTGTMPLKSLPRSKAARPQPYSRKNQQRYHLRRTHTQPMRPPMRTPAFHPPGPPVLFNSPILHQRTPPPQYVSSRVCTPIPSPMASPTQMIDPALSAQSPGVSRSNNEEAEAFSIKLTKDELRAMMFEVFQQAVKGLEAAKAPEVEASNGEQGVTMKKVGEISHECDNAAEEQL